MNNRQLSYFLEVFKSRSIKDAAKKLVISPQGLSKTLKLLESELDTTLFKRTSKGLEPTDAAIVLKAHAEKVIQEYDMIIENTKNQGNSKKVLTISSTYGIFQYLTISFLRDFLHAYPDIILNFAEITDYPAIEKLKSGEVELALLPGPFDTTVFTGQYLFSHRLCLVINTDNPLSKKDKIRFEDLKDQPMARPSRDYVCYNIHMNQFIQHGVQPLIYLETTNHSIIHSIAEHNLAVGISLDYMAFSDIRPNTVIRPFEDESCVKTIYIAEKRNSSLSPDAYAFKTFIIEWVNQHKTQMFNWDVYDLVESR
ncbi:MAG: LysR family transcriptional regulator [Eubacteriales bacterium]